MKVSLICEVKIGEHLLFTKFYESQNFIFCGSFFLLSLINYIFNKFYSFIITPISYFIITTLIFFFFDSNIKNKYDLFHEFTYY